MSDIPDLSGRHVLVTGANSGLGLETARVLARAGASVLLGCRDRAKAEVAQSAIAAEATGGPPTIVDLDLADLDSVRGAAATVGGQIERLDGLVNNAGVMAIPFAKTSDGFEMQLGTNHLGHFALTGLLVPLLLEAPAPRVVTVSSLAHWSGRIRWADMHFDRGYHRWLAYAQSKLANLLFAAELDRRAAGTALVSVAAHPGIVPTNLYASAGASRHGARRLGQSAESGARPQLRALVDEGLTGGEYVGPMFEAWGPPRRVARSPLARRRPDARRLWELSQVLTGVAYPASRVSPE
jgi:NAD(P)-dependent dehydrogenase (short-subunit alcohol dehydrogenase family)